MRSRRTVVVLALTLALAGVTLPARVQAGEDTCEPGQASIAGCLKAVGVSSLLGGRADSPTSAATYVGAIIQAALALVGVIFLAQMVYAGYLWMTARGESDQVDKAKETITRSIIGLAVVLAAWAITAFVVDRLLIASGGFGI